MLALTLPHRTWAHRLSARTKLTALALATLALYPTDDIGALSACVAAVAALYASLGPDRRFGAAREGARMLRPLGWMAALILLWHAATGQIAEGARISLRIVAAVGLANLVTMTTRLDDMMAVAERIAAPFRLLGLEPRALALSAALVARFAPVLAQRGADLSDAWRARSPRRPDWRIVAPFCLSALDDAEHVADALRARGGVAPGGRGGS